MNSRNVTTLFLVAIISLFVLLSAADPWRLADGGAPVPPYPPSSNLLIADGGAPVPPYPPSFQSPISL